MAARSSGDFFARSNGRMDILSDFTGVVMGLGMFVDVAVARTGGGPLGRDFLLNLRHFRSEALVLGNDTVGCFDDKEGVGPMVGVDVWVTFAVLEGASFVDLCF